MLTWCQVVAFVCCGFGSIWLWVPGFGVSVLVSLWRITGEPSLSFVLTPFVSLVPPIAYGVLVHRWLARADRRARLAVVIGTAAIVASLVASLVMSLMDGSNLVAITIITAVPSLVIQVIVLRLLFSREGCRWFTSQASKLAASGSKSGSGSS